MKILFLCVANSARSQMAEGLARHLFGSQVEVASAGSHPSGQVHRQAIQTMKEKGIDISSHRSTSVEELPEDFLTKTDYVITLCGDEVCPAIVSQAEKIHWPLPDPAGAEPSAQPESFRNVFDELDIRLKEFGKERGLSFS